MKPILFNTEMVQAILGGRKTTTRRLIKPQPPKELQYPYGFITGSTDKKEVGKFCWTHEEICDGRTHTVRPPYQKGDILYVRETWAQENVNKEDVFIFKADGWERSGLKWKPSIHMPKEAARIFLKVTDVRAERLQDITADDIRSEGLTSMAVHCGDMEIATPEWKILWDSTIKKQDLDKYGWDVNPWVWVIEFERVVR